MIYNLILRIRDTERLPLYMLLLMSCLFCFVISLFRCFLTDSSLFFLFMNKNLFLAFIPFAISSFLVLYPSIQQKKYLFIGLLFLWFIFFPNSPYIVTDLFHLKPRANSELWLDLGILFSFAWTGLIFGMISLMDIEKMLVNRIGKVKMNALIVSFLFLTGFGIYLGRYLRWNSWDIINQPLYLFSDIMSRMVYPLDHPRTWGMTLLYGGLLNLIYYTVKCLRR